MLSPVVHVKFPIKTKDDETTLLIEVLLTCRKVEPSDWWIIKLVWKQRSTDPSFRLLVVCGACARVYDEFIPVFASFPIHKVDVLAPAAEAGKAPSSSKVEKKVAVYKFIRFSCSNVIRSRHMRFRREPSWSVEWWVLNWSLDAVQRVFPWQQVAVDAAAAEWFRGLAVVTKTSSADEFDRSLVGGLVQIYVELRQRMPSTE